MNKIIKRRNFLKKLLMATGTMWLAPYFFKTEKAMSSAVADIYISKNGSPHQNMEKLFELKYGGIQNFISRDDIVVLKVNAQWPQQGYTNTKCLKAIIDLILNRPGGFIGEIVIVDNIQQVVSSWAYSGWGTNNTDHNWINLDDLVAAYSAFPNVYKVHLENVSLASETWEVIENHTPDTPSNLSAGKNGWVRVPYVTTAGDTVTLGYPVIRSRYTKKIFNLSKNLENGVWEGGSYNSQKIKLIFLPTLNFHGSYAGVTSAVKTHLGIVEMPNTYTGTRSGKFDDGTWTLHTIGFPQSDVIRDNSFLVGEAVGELITNIINPSLYITCAEWSGNGGRYGDGSATLTKAIGMCDDPVSLDYYMGKTVLVPCGGSPWLDPDNGGFKEVLGGCNSKGVGTVDASMMNIRNYDFNNPQPPANTTAAGPAVKFLLFSKVKKHISAKH